MTASVMPKEERFASADQLAQAIRALAPSDHIKLGAVARMRAARVAGLDWEDLLQEAVSRALGGRRRWPFEVPLVHFLAGVMRSIASDHARRRALGSEISVSDPDHEVALAAIAADTPGAEEIAAERDLAVRLRLLFDGDADALAIIEGLSRGLTAAEIQQSAGMEQGRYDSSRRRIRRQIAQSNLSGEK